MSGKKQINENRIELSENIIRALTLEIKSVKQDLNIKPNNAYSSAKLEDIYYALKHISAILD